MVKWPALIAAVVAIPSLAWTGDDRMVVKKSSHSVAATLNRLSEVLKTKGIGIMARVDHAAAAEKVGQTLKPKIGYPLDAVESKDRRRTTVEGARVGGRQRAGVVGLRQAGGSQVGIFNRWPRRHIQGNGSGAREVDRRSDQAELTSGSSVGLPKDGVRLQWHRLSVISRD